MRKFNFQRELIERFLKKADFSLKTIAEHSRYTSYIDWDNVSFRKIPKPYGTNEECFLELPLLIPYNINPVISLQLNLSWISDEEENWWSKNGVEIEGAFKEQLEDIKGKFKGLRKLLTESDDC